MRPANFQGNIHIINFPAAVTPGELAALFDDFGLVMGAQIKSITSTGGNLRLGIVAVAPDDAADRAIAALQGYRMGDQKLKLKRAVPPVKAEPKAKPPAPRPARTLSVASEHFPAREAPQSKVIVEYKKRRSPVRL
jgi:RNA recognition motif-containing protein